MTPMTSVRVTVLVLLVCLPSLLATNSTHTDQLLQRIMFGSCFNPQLGGQIWTVINSFSPNQLILLGDNIYADRIVEKPIFTVTPTEIETQYKLLVNDAHWKKLFATVGGWDSISITYDDHDYGINNADKYFPYRNESQHLFWHYTDAYTRQNINRESVPSGVYSSSTRTVTNRAGQDILKYKTVLIDNRSNKDPKGTVNGDFLGEEQWQWLAKELLLVDKDIDMILLGSGIQVLPDEKLVEENWSEFPAAKDRLMTLICLSPVANIFILSGDIHSAEVNKATCKVTGTVTVPDGTSELLEVSRPVLEFTSSGLTRTFITKTVQQQENNTVTDIRCTSKGQFYEFINGLYQTIYPAQYREMRYADAFHGIHFALLDIATASSGTVDSHSISRSDDGDHSTELELVLKVIDHAGKLVLNRKFDLHRNNFESSRASESLRRQLMEEYNSHLNARSNWLSHVSVEIIPYWGHLSIWRRILTNACAAFAILTIVIMPLLALLWFILAGLYYLLYEKEFRRRDNLMKLHQQ